MAQFNVYGISELITKMNRMGAVEEIAPEMLEAGMEVLQPEVKAAAEKHRDSTGISIKNRRLTPREETSRQAAKNTSR